MVRPYFPGEIAMPAADGAMRRVYANPFHQAQIDHQPIVAEGQSRSVVTATAYRQQKVSFPGEVHSRDHIGDVSASCDQRRMLVDHRIVDGPRLVVSRIPRLDQFATKRCAQLGDSAFLQSHCAVGDCLDSRSSHD
jgi:hypothetical protein